MTTTEATATKRPPSEEPTEATSPKKQKTSTTEQATTGPAVADVIISFAMDDFNELGF